MKVYLDFDGTVVEHGYPKIGRCNFGCFEVIKKLQDAGHDVVLNTYRANCNDGTLEKALKYVNEDYWMFIKDRSLRDSFQLKPIGSTKEKLDPPMWDMSWIKEYQEMYIDDIASCIPLKKASMVEGMMVDWDKLDKLFEEHGIYNNIEKYNTFLESQRDKEIFFHALLNPGEPNKELKKTASIYNDELNNNNMDKLQQSIEHLKSLLSFHGDKATAIKDVSFEKLNEISVFIKENDSSQTSAK